MIGNDWDKELSVIWNSKYFQAFYNKILKMYDEKTIFPAKENIFNALKLRSLSRCRGSSWLIFFCPKRGQNSTFLTKYL